MDLFKGVRSGAISPFLLPTIIMIVLLTVIYMMSISLISAKMVNITAEDDLALEGGQNTSPDEWWVNWSGDGVSRVKLAQDYGTGFGGIFGMVGLIIGIALVLGTIGLTSDGGIGGIGLPNMGGSKRR